MKEKATMDKNQQLMQVRTKKLGVLVKDARCVSRRSSEECAMVMGISVENYEQLERGKFTPSLPQIEALAFFFNIPLEHFWGNKVVCSETSLQSPESFTALRQLRDRYLGVRLRQLRTEANLSLEELAKKTSLPLENLDRYESGKASIPLPELEVLLRTLSIRVEEVFDQNGPIGEWRTQQQMVQEFLELSPRHQQFISKPVNIPFIELAMRLNDLSVEKLRSIAEGLLEITY